MYNNIDIDRYGHTRNMIVRYGNGTRNMSVRTKNEKKIKRKKKASNKWHS